MREEAKESRSLLLAMSGAENIDVPPVNVWSILPDQGLVCLQHPETVQPRGNRAVVVPKYVWQWNFSHHRVPGKIRDPEQRFEDDEDQQCRDQPLTDVVENSLTIHLV